MMSLICGVQNDTNKLISKTHRLGKQIYDYHSGKVEGGGVGIN